MAITGTGKTSFAPYGAMMEFRYDESYTKVEAVYVPPKGGGTPKKRDRLDLKEQLRKQYDKEIQQILDNLVIEELIDEPEALSQKPLDQQIRFEVPDVSRLLPEIKADISTVIRQRYEKDRRNRWQRELQVRLEERQRALAKLEEELTQRLEEELVAILVMGHLID